jgi:Bardet-Biedl syndrome 2 protein
LIHFILKVFIHNPHQKYNISNGGRSDNQALLDSNLSLLNINAVVTALATGILDSASKNEYLLVGTKTNVLAYDVDNNVDLFHKDVKFIY